MSPGAHGPLNLVDQRPDYREHCGPVAEDVPEIMQVEGPDGRHGIDLQTNLGLLLAIAQRQQRQIDALTAERDAQSARIDALESRLAAAGL